MSVAEAQALCPGALRLPFLVEKSRQSMARLAKWCWRFSPSVAIDPDSLGNPFDDGPDGLLLDVTGEAHLFGGEHLLLAQVASQFKSLGLSARLAIAPTCGAAWALARFAPHEVVTVGKEQMCEAIEPLPVLALRLPAHTCAALQQVGIEKIHQLLKLPRASLLARYGEVVLQRLDQALGHLPELIEPLRLTEAIAVRRLFDGAATQIEAVMLTVEQLLRELCGRLERQESGVRGLRIELSRLNAPSESRDFVVGKPNRDATYLWKLVRPKVEAMHLGYGVESVAVTAYWAETICHQQSGAWGMGQSVDAQEEAYEAFVDMLVSRWGNDRVLTAQPVASYVPERARAFASVRGDAFAATENILPMDRPSMLLEHPEPAHCMALQPDHPPSWIKWRGQEHPLQQGTGPERIVSEWWSGDSYHNSAAARDYFRVQTAAGLWLWIFRELKTGQWFVHGLWT